jgi:hypothetical protein
LSGDESGDYCLESHGSDGQKQQTGVVAGRTSTPHSWSSCFYSAREDSGKHTTTHADVIIVGAGIAGNHYIR